MPMPAWLLPALTVGSGLASSIFGPKMPDLPPAPEFFGKGFDEYLARRRQATQARYGSLLGDMREHFGNLGLLGNPGALAAGATQAGIAQGQDILGQEADAFGQERQAEQAFTSNRYLDAARTRNQFDLSMYGQRQAAVPDALKQAVKMYILQKYLNQREGTQQPDSLEWWKLFN